MTVIVTDQEGKIYVLCKGADSILEKKVTLNSELIEITNKHLIDFAKKGLRTLMFVYKEMSLEDLKEWEVTFNVLTNLSSKHSCKEISFKLKSVIEK